MRKTGKRLLLIGVSLSLLAVVPVAVWVSLTHKPKFYRAAVALPREQREVKAKQFVAQSLQLRNDIVNEPAWEAVFSDQEVNAWLAEDLVTHFADQLPPEVHEPRVIFEVDRVTLAFELDQGPIRSVIWVVARPRVPEENVLELTLEKIRAGVLPVSAEKILPRIGTQAKHHGFDVQWKYDENKLAVVTIRYTPVAGRDDVRLEQVQVRDGQMRLAGTSNRSKGVVRAPTLPTRKVLQSKFPRRKVQAKGVSNSPSVPSPGPRSSTAPTS